MIAAPPTAPTVLMVSYSFPRPGSGHGSIVGGERMRQFARYLPEHGFTPLVLTHRGIEQPDLQLQLEIAHLHEKVDHMQEDILSRLAAIEKRLPRS